MQSTSLVHRLGLVGSMKRFALRRRILLGCSLAVMFSAGSGRADFQGATHLMPFEEDTINYNQAEPHDAVARLQKEIASGKATLRYDKDYGYLVSLLEWLKIPQSSQMLVFSKTSLQRERISPRTPRAIFFNEDVYVGFIPGAPLIEISAVDPKLGGVFYTLDQTEPSRAKLVRNNQCTECHASAKTMGVPGHIVRSFATDENGIADITSGTSQVNHRTPFEDRWGGWYVTGTHGAQTHRGNLMGKAAFAKREQQPNFAGNVTNLTDYFDVSPYFLNQSDIVALMVLEHQTHMHNFLTRLNYESTLALQQYGHIRYLKSISEAFLKYLLFTEETKLTAPVQGSALFAHDFVSRGPRDSRGRSLRDLDLKTRLFKYPCSYLIYSEAFDALPDPMKAHLYQRLWEILTGKDQNATFATLTPEMRRAILEILIETRKGLPDYWKLDSEVQTSQNASPEKAAPKL